MKKSELFKKVFGVALAGVMGISLIACGGGNSGKETPAAQEEGAGEEGNAEDSSEDAGSEGADAGAEQNEAAAPSGDVLEVSFWSAPNQDQFLYWETKADTFNETNTEVNGQVVQIKVQQMPESPSSEAGIQNAIATGTVPAASENISRGFSATLADSEVVYDLQDEQWYQDIVAERAIETAIEGWEIDGKQYVIPVYINPMSWQWNVKALDALGFSEAPSTMEEFKAVIGAFADNRDVMNEIGVTHTLYRNSLQRGDMWWERYYDFQMPYQTFTGGSDIVDGNSLVMDQEGAVKAFEFIGMLGNTIQMSELTDLWTGEDVSVLFSVNAPWEISQLREAGKVYGEDYIYGPSIIEKEGDTAYYYADAKGITFYKHDSISDDEHEGVVAFIKWAYSSENSSQTDFDWLQATTMLPVRGDLTENETFAEMLDEYPELKQLAAYIPYAIPSMAHPNVSEIQAALTDAGLSPYMDVVNSVEPLEAPDATSYVEAAIDAMRAEGGLE